MPNFRATFFKRKADKDLKASKDVLGLQYDTSTYPYYAGEYHAKAIIFPLAHSYHALKNLGRILEGVLLCVHAVFNDPLTSLPAVLTGMLEEVGALVLNVINAMASIVTFITRSLATLFNLGYTSTAVANFEQSMSGVEVGGNNPLGLLTAVGVGVGDQMAHLAEEAVTSATLSW